LVVVELQQFCFGQGSGSGVPHPDGQYAIAPGVSGMGKASGQDGADRDAYPL
jgi:hypothetical protein